MPPAARVGDSHDCSKVTGVVPHVGGPIIGPGAATVLIESMPASIVGDMCLCIGPPDKTVKGSGTVMICGKPAVRLGDQTDHGGAIVAGAGTVMIGG
ncbi:MAG: PAAR domain-containing protein [Planctomycetaceae bacterium]